MIMLTVTTHQKRIMIRNVKIPVLYLFINKPIIWDIETLLDKRYLEPQEVDSIYKAVRFAENELRDYLEEPYMDDKEIQLHSKALKKDKKLRKMEELKKLTGLNYEDSMVWNNYYKLCCEHREKRKKALVEYKKKYYKLYLDHLMKVNENSVLDLEEKIERIRKKLCKS